ncbi:MAG TPA: hypothetical protein VLL82_14625, partial [Mycobacterium sp.]|nr:hypothetical protein [Mycobacterium sp.]
QPMDDWLIAVIVPMGIAVQCEYDSTLKQPEDPTLSLQLLGFLTDFRGCDGSPDSVAAMQRDLAGFGVTEGLGWVVQRIASAEGTSTVGLMLGLVVDTIERARELPSFVPLVVVTGPHPLPTPGVGYAQ